MILITWLLFQSSPGFVDNTVLTAAKLNSAFSGKLDTGAGLLLFGGLCALIIILFFTCRESR